MRLLKKLKILMRSNVVNKNDLIAIKKALSNKVTYRRKMYTKGLFDKVKGLYSVSEASKLLGVGTQKIYRAIYSKKLPHIRKEKFYVLHIDDIKQYEKELKHGH